MNETDARVDHLQGQLMARGKQLYDLRVHADNLQAEAVRTTAQLEKLDVAGHAAITDWPMGSTQPQFGDGLDRLLDLPGELVKLKAVVEKLGLKYPDQLYNEGVFGMHVDRGETLLNAMNRWYTEFDNARQSQAKEIESLKAHEPTWAELMEVIDKRYPPEVFGKGSDDNTGPRIVELCREVERLRAGLREIYDDDLSDKRVRHSRDCAIMYARKTARELLAAKENDHGN